MDLSSPFFDENHGRPIDKSDKDFEYNNIHIQSTKTKHHSLLKTKYNQPLESQATLIS